MVLPRRDVQPLSVPRTDVDSSEPLDMPRPLPEHGHPVVSDRPLHGEEDRLSPTRAVLHVALVVPDLKLYGILRNAAWLIQPVGWDGTIKLHIIQQRPNTEPEELINRFALATLGLVTPEVAALQYPEEIEIGWNDDTTSTNRG